MRRFHRAIAERDPGVGDAINSQLFYAPDRSDYIENRIDGADFVQVQLVGRYSVNCRLDGSDRLECLVREARDFFRDLHGVDQAVDLGHRAPVWLGRNVKIDFHAVHCRPLDVGDSHANAVEPKRRGQTLEPGAVKTDVNERTDEHVAGDSARRIENRDLHVNEVEEIDIRCDEACRAPLSINLIPR